MDESLANKVYMQRFNSESSKKLGIFINDYECFYIVNNEMVNLLGKIYFKKLYFISISY